MLKTNISEWFFWILPQHTRNRWLKHTIPPSTPIQKHRRSQKISETSEFSKRLDELMESFINRGYKGNFLIDQFNQISKVTREALSTSKLKIANKLRIPLVLKFNRTLPNIKKIIDKQWHYCRSILH